MYRKYQSETIERAVGRRKAGASIRQIADEFGISKSTATVWTRHLGPDVRLAPHRRGGKWKTEQARQNRLAFTAEADQLWPVLSKDPEFMFGLGIYIGEGDKGGGVVGVTNCDANVLRAAMVFMERIGVDRSRMKIYIHVHEEPQVAGAERFWCDTFGLGRGSLGKTQVVVPRSSKRASKRRHENGTCQLRASSTRLSCMIARWSALALQRSSNG